MRKVLISDCHGNFDALKECLINANVINEKGNRLTDAQNRSIVYSVGDLANCCDEFDADYECLSKVGSYQNAWIDYLIIGNHEIPYFDSTNIFNGFHFNFRVNEELKRIENENRLRPAALLGSCLITHAGWDKDTHPYITTPQEAYQALTEAHSREGWTHRFFSAIGHARGGRLKHGGILWEDFNAIRSPFPQIVGHTVGNTIRAKDNIICIDTGGGKHGKPTAIVIS